VQRLCRPTLGAAAALNVTRPLERRALSTQSNSPFSFILSGSTSGPTGSPYAESSIDASTTLRVLDFLRSVARPPSSNPVKGRDSLTRHRRLTGYSEAPCFRRFTRVLQRQCLR
jgi:hypothetical protein